MVSHNGSDISEMCIIDDLFPRVNIHEGGRFPFDIVAYVYSLPFSLAEFGVSTPTCRYSARIDLSIRRDDRFKRRVAGLLRPLDIREFSFVVVNPPRRRIDRVAINRDCSACNPR